MSTIDYIENTDICTSNVRWNKSRDHWLGRTECLICYNITSQKRWASSRGSRIMCYCLQFKRRKRNKDWINLPGTFYSLDSAKHYAEYHYRWAIT